MASEQKVKSNQDLALDAVEIIDGHLCGALSAEEVHAWAHQYALREWDGSSGLIVGAAIDAMMSIGPGEYDTSRDQLREFREYLLGERDYVVRHRMVHWKTDRAAFLKKA